MNQVLYKFLKYFTFDQPSAICYSLTYSVDIDNYWIEKMKEIFWSIKCVYIHVVFFFTKMIHLIWVIKYFVVKQDFCTSDTAYLTIPISASRAETDPAGLIWICRADTDSSGVFFFCYKTKFHICIKVKLWTWLDC